MATATLRKNGTIVVSALNARSHFGKLRRRSLISERHGTPAGVLMNIRDYVKLAAPEPEVLKIIGDQAAQNRTNALSSRKIDQVIKAARPEKKRR